MKLAEKIVRYLQDYLNDQTYNCKLLFPRCTPEILQSIIDYIGSDPSHRLMRNGVVVPVIYCIPDEKIITSSDEGYCYNNQKYAIRDDAESAQRSDRDAYLHLGWAIGDNSFCTTVRNTVDTFVLLYGTQIPNESLQNATANVGIKKDCNGGHALLAESGFQRFLPILRTGGENAWAVHSGLIGSIFGELGVAEAWHLLELLCEAEDERGELGCRDFEAVMGLPFSEEGAVVAKVLKRQTETAGCLAEKFENPVEFDDFTDYLRTAVEDAYPDEDTTLWFEEFIDFVRTSRVMHSAFSDKHFYWDYMYDVHTEGLEKCPGWWEKLTLEIFEKALSNSPTASSCKFEVDVQDDDVVYMTEFKDAKQPIVVRSQAAFEFSKTEGIKSLDVVINRTPLEKDIELHEPFLYEPEGKEKEHTIKFVAALGGTDTVTRASRLIVLEQFLPGCYVTAIPSEKINSAIKTFKPSRKGSKRARTFDSSIELKNVAGKVNFKIFTASYLEIDETSFEFVSEKGGNSAAEKLKFISIDGKFSGQVAVDLIDGGGTLTFCAGKGTNRRTYHVDIKVVVDNRNVGGSADSVYRELQHASRTGKDCQLSVNEAAIASQLSQKHIDMVCRSEQLGAYAYPVILSTDTLLCYGSCWNEGNYDCLTERAFANGFDNRATSASWKTALERPEAQEYFQAQRSLFAYLKEQSSENVVIEKLLLVQSEGSAELGTLIEKYAVAYKQWLTADYATAIAADTYWVYTTKDSTGMLSEGPMFILFPPEHPVRLGWQYLAQTVMNEMRMNGRCSSVVSSFDSSQALDYLQLPMRNEIFRTSVEQYYSLRSTSDYWGVLYRFSEDNRSVLTNAEMLFSPDFGVRLTGVRRTITRGEVTTALSAVREVCLAKDMLNITLADIESSNESLSVCNSAIVDWCQKTASEGMDPIESLGPRRFNVYCEHKLADNSEIYTAREASGNKLFWHSQLKHVEDGGAKNDVTIASLGGQDVYPCAALKDGSQAGVSAAGALLRYRTRVRSFGSGQKILESRRAVCASTYSACAFENTFGQLIAQIENHSDITQLKEDSVKPFCQFNTGLHGLLEKGNSYYYAVSSADIDQSCFMQDNPGPAGKTFYLWDYTLPGVTTEARNTEGFYLLAGETTTVCQSVSKAFESLCKHRFASDDEIRNVLFMSAKRGIPTIRKLSSGGTNALGEAGILIALHTLQGHMNDSASEGILPPIVETENDVYVNIVVPMDAFRERYEQLCREQMGAKSHPGRPDLVVFSICRAKADLTVKRMRVSFVEVKARKGVFEDLEHALNQYENIYKLFTLKDSARYEQWGRTDFLIAMLSFGFRVYESVPCVAQNGYLNGLHPVVVRKLWEDPDFCSFNPTSRVFVVHNSASALAYDGRAVVLNCDDAYKSFKAGKLLDETFRPVMETCWHLLADDDVGPSDGGEGFSQTELLLPGLSGASDNEAESAVGTSDPEETVPVAPASEDVSDSSDEPIQTEETVPVTPVPEHTSDSSDKPIQPAIEQLELLPKPEPPKPAVVPQDPTVMDGETLSNYNGLRAGFSAFGIHTDFLGIFKKTPNQIYFDFRGTGTCTKKNIDKNLTEFMTTHGVQINRVQPGIGKIRIFCKRIDPEKPTINEVWEQAGYTSEVAHEKGILIAVKEEDGDPLFLNPIKGVFPHSLVAGTTNSGKSVLLRNMLLSLVKNFSVNDARVFILDPKKVDFRPFADSSIVTYVTEKEKALEVFRFLDMEVERRLDVLGQYGVDKLADYVKLTNPNKEALPQIWLFHDEFQDWYLGNEDYKECVDKTVTRLAAKGRAAGIFLVFATQRPDKDVLPVNLRSNLSNRLILKVSDIGTSDICLGNLDGEWNATKLMGQGHMIGSIDNNPCLCQVPNVPRSMLNEMLGK